jgi:hypothetical protein
VAPRAKIPHGMFALGVHLFSTHCPDAVHWQANPRVRLMAHDGAVHTDSRSNSKNERTNFMNTYKQLLPRTILLGSVGLAAMLLVSTPSCKAQEVSPDHFTDTGVQNVYEGSPAKVAAPVVKQNLLASQPRAHRINSSAAAQPAAKRTSLLYSQLETPAVADKRQPVATTPKKQ